MPPLCNSEIDLVDFQYSRVRSYPTSATKYADRPRKSVSFNTSVQVKNVLHLKNYTGKERDATWYNGFEYQMMKEDRRYTVQMVNSGLLQDDTATCCRRGLEFWTRKGARRRKINRAIAYSVVLEEQERQWEEGIYQPEFLAKMYLAASRDCQVVANSIALKDYVASR